MPLETGTYISDLVSTNPAHTDSVGQADSHLRFIKSTLLASFTAVAGAVTVTHTQINSAVAAVVTGLAQAVHAAGTVGAPGVAFLGSLTSGLYSPAANQVAISAGGVQCLLAKPDGSLSGGTGQLGIIGEPRLWLSNTLPAGNFAWLNGQTVLVASNPVLFGLWGYAYGGNGTTTMGLPNWQGVVPVGRATMGGAADPGLVANSGPTAGITTLGTILGEGKHALTSAEGPVHSHGINDPGHAHGPPSGMADFWGTPGTTTDTIGSGTNNVPRNRNASTGSNTTGITIQNAGSGTAHNVVQPSFVTNWIVLLG